MKNTKRKNPDNVPSVGDTVIYRAKQRNLKHTITSSAGDMFQMSDDNGHVVGWIPANDIIVVVSSGGVHYVPNLRHTSRNSGHNSI